MKEEHMGLLLSNTDPKLIMLAQKIFDQQFEADPKLEREMDDRRKQLMFQDILYNFSFLSTAVHLEDEKIFTTYASWLYELLCNLMRDLDRDRIKDQMVDHYAIIRKFVDELFSPEEGKRASAYLDRAIAITDESVASFPVSQRFSEGKHVDIRKEYLSALMRSETHQAIDVILKARQSGIPLEEIFEDIIMITMHEVGELWHQNRITVDKEHYCTSTTQMVLSMFYPDIFGTPRTQRMIITCCVGSELHEMGGRMVSDLFEYRGWDSIYLGAAVPRDSLLHAVEEHKPHLVALSVTMPQYLGLCREAVYALKDAHPSVRVAVGGRAFATSDGLHRKWPVDMYTSTASELLAWAEKEFNEL